MLAVTSMPAADLQLKMSSATRNLSLALQQCDIKHNMAMRNKLVSAGGGVACLVISLQGCNCCHAS